MTQESDALADPLNLSLLRELVGDGRVSHVDLGHRIGLSPTACARRQKGLEDAGVIVGYQAVLGLDRLGLGTTVLVRITLESQSEESFEAFEHAIAQCPSVVRCFLMSGTDDYMVTVLARDIGDFEAIHRTQLSRLPAVSRIQSNFALREIVNRAVPPVALTRPERRRRG